MNSKSKALKKKGKLGEGQKVFRALQSGIERYHGKK